MLNAAPSPDGAAPAVAFALPRPPAGKGLLASLARWRRRRRRRALILAAKLFDAEWYRRSYPDVAAARIDPLTHFLEHGSFEGRSPGKGFDTLIYLIENPDVASTGIEPWLHFVLHGRAEGRLPHD